MLPQVLYPSRIILQQRFRVIVGIHGGRRRAYGIHVREIPGMEEDCVVCGREHLCREVEYKHRELIARVREMLVDHAAEVVDLRHGQSKLGANTVQQEASTCWMEHADRSAMPSRMREAERQKASTLSSHSTPDWHMFSCRTVMSSLCSDPFICRQSA